MNARRVLTWSLAASICLAGAPAAHAEPDPGRGTSQADVDRAHRAVDAQEARVASIQADLDRARADLTQAQDAAALAQEQATAAAETLRAKTTAAAEARRRADAAQQRAATSQGALEQLAARIYMQGGPILDLAWLFAGDTAGLARDEADIAAASGHRSLDLAESRQAQQDAEAARTAADAAEQEQKTAAAQATASLAAAQRAQQAAEKDAAALAAREKAMVAELAQLRRTSVEVEKRRQEQLAREAAQAEAARVQARIAAQQAAAQRAAARAAAQRRTAGESVAAPADLPAPDSQAAAKAIAFAQAQLGKPYLWGGTGPDAFDCSGLTLGAWTSAGRTLPRVAQWQYRATTRVPISELRPGDLVFFGHDENSIYHVGLYVGNGRMIEAPRTGLNIRYSSIYRSTLMPTGGRV